MRNIVRNVVNELSWLHREWGAVIYPSIFYGIAIAIFAAWLIAINSQ